MKILSDQKLVNEVRKKSDLLCKRFWVAVPYIGNLSSVRKITGNKWINNNAVDVRFITDISSLTNFNSDSLRKFLDRGVIKSIPGLHAKVYIIDDTSFITSANLTNTAFSKRAEVGVYLDKTESKELIKQFDSWWKEGEIISKIKIARKIKSKPIVSKDEKAGLKLPIRNALLEDPGSDDFHIPLRYLNYDNLVAVYKDFASKYSSTVNRIWPDAPIFMEVDTFLDYLYHHDEQPSNKFKDKNPRRLSYNDKIKEIRKYYKGFKDFVEDNMLAHRKKGSRISQKHLSKGNINHLTIAKLRMVLDHINSLTTFGFHKKNVLEKNTIQKLRRSLNTLLHSNESLPIRFMKCSELKNFKESSMYEMLGLYYPEEYPLINNNSLSGLRFFGYDVWLK
jgi:hypothetical protein